MPKTMNFSTIPLAELTAKELAPVTDSARRVVLVVDDETVIADTLAVILGQAGLTVMVAYDGPSALEFAKIVPPDLLLTDVVMPGMTGVDLAIALTQAVPACKVLLFSGQAATADLLSEAGADFTVLAKPLHPTDLLARLSQTLEIQPSETEGAPAQRKAPSSPSAIHA